ncbi:MAG TPA: DUF6184 family natural product biosynthesis lipoprotein [Labilithrix sp.]
MFAVVGACGGAGDVGRGAQTTLTSGETHPSKPPESRTVDSAGFVDNGGRATEETTARPDTAGVRPTETGSDRPTGTNTGIPNGARTDVRPEAPLAPKTAALQPHGNLSPVAGYNDEPGKLGRAMCDHETICNRVGTGRTWGSDDACTSTLRARAISELDAAQCTLDPSAIATCLAAIRNAPCDRVIDRPSAIDLCQDASVCSR